MDNHDQLLEHQLREQIAIEERVCRTIEAHAKEIDEAEFLDAKIC